MGVNILAIFGSPRQGGNTDTLLEAMLKSAEAHGAIVERLFIRNLSIAPCRECRSCHKTGECVIQDDMQGIYPKLLRADVIIVASPIFFYHITAQLKCLIDRCQALWARKYILQNLQVKNGRKGYFISVGATRGARLFDGAILTVKYFFDAIGVVYANELLVRGIDEMGEVNEHKDAIAMARKMGKEMALSLPAY